MKIYYAKWTFPTFFHSIRKIFCYVKFRLYLVKWPLNLGGIAGAGGQTNPKKSGRFGISMDWSTCDKNSRVLRDMWENPIGIWCKVTPTPPKVKSQKGFDLGPTFLLKIFVRSWNFQIFGLFWVPKKIRKLAITFLFMDRFCWFLDMLLPSECPTRWKKNFGEIRKFFFSTFSECDFAKSEFMEKIYADFAPYIVIFV